jgi:hypothetical protein
MVKRGRHRGISDASATPSGIKREWYVCILSNEKINNKGILFCPILFRTIISSFSELRPCLINGAKLIFAGHTHILQSITQRQIF